MAAESDNLNLKLFVDTAKRHLQDQKGAGDADVYAILYKHIPLSIAPLHPTLLTHLPENLKSCPIYNDHNAAIRVELGVDKEGAITGEFYKISCATGERASVEYVYPIMGLIGCEPPGPPRYGTHREARKLAELLSEPRCAWFRQLLAARMLFSRMDRARNPL